MLAARTINLVFCTLLAASVLGQGRPNIIFILADDVGIGDLGAYGQDAIRTPSLDQLAADGTRFTQMYSGAPVCSPSRAILMTGLHNGRHVNGNGINLQAGNVTVAEVLKSAGYATGGFGKWHLGSGAQSLPTNQGFDEYYGILDGVAAWDHFAPNLQRLSSAAPSTIVNEANNGGFTDDLVGAEAAQFVRSHAQAGQPFYAQVNFQLAHFDMEVPELEAYTIDQPWPESRKIFASMITRLDRLVGDIVAAVDDPNDDGDTSDSVAANTLIVFASDNGTHIEPQNCCKGNHGPDLGVFSDDPHDPEFFDSNGQYRGWKRDLYDGGIKTPFIVRWSGTVAAGTTNNTLFGDFADFLPTAAELAGVEAPIGIDGESYAHLLAGTAGPLDFARPFQYFEGGGSIGGIPAVPAVRALIRDGYKAIQFADGRRELYNLANDPTESTDLYSSMNTFADEMIATALAQDGGQINYRHLVAGQFFRDPAAWAETTAPSANSIATLLGDGTTQLDVYLDASANVLGLEIGGSATPVRLVVLPDRTVESQNGLRVRSGSELRLERGLAATTRRVELSGGRLSGHGDVVGVLVNAGIVAPDTMFSAPPQPPAEPNRALAFDFTGVQDDAPLLQTSLLHPQLLLTSGLDFGPGTQPRSGGPDGFTGSDAGDEFNIGGFDRSSLAEAVAAGDYLTYTVQSAPGFEMLLESASFDLWRNGVNAANDYAILTSLEGFAAGSELAQLNDVVASGAPAIQTFTATYDGQQPTSDPVEVRLYAWNANDDLASTHIKDVQLNATFVRSGTDDALDFNFVGVQDDSPLTQTLVLDPRLNLTQGFSYGPGTQPRSSDGNFSTDAGNEFNAGGFSTSSLAAAVSAGDYLTFTVTPVEGFEMSLTSVSYDLWRNGVNAANDYAIMTSIDGFADGSELAQLNNITSSGSTSEQRFTAFYTRGVAVSGPLEVRLYGWNANDTLASTHITAVSMDATFTLAGTANFGQTTGSSFGRIELDGDYVQTPEGVLSFELGGAAAGLEHDQLVVAGRATLDGLVQVVLAQDFLPAEGNSFDVLTAEVVVGTFAARSLPKLPGGLEFTLVYNPTSVQVIVSGVVGDYNYDGIVNLADYTVWRDALGQHGRALPADGDGNGLVDAGDFAVWKLNFGRSVASANFQRSAVPEPSAIGLGAVVLVATLAWLRNDQLMESGVYSGAFRPGHSTAR